MSGALGTVVAGVTSGVLLITGVVEVVSTSGVVVPVSITFEVVATIGTEGAGV